MTSWFDHTINGLIIGNIYALLAVGLALINTILTNRSALHYERLAESVNWNNPAAVDQLGAMTANNAANGLDAATAALQQMSGMVQQQAYVMSFIDVFLLLTGLFAILAFGAMLMKKPAPMSGGGGGH